MSKKWEAVQEAVGAHDEGREQNRRHADPERRLGRHGREQGGGEHRRARGYEDGPREAMCAAPVVLARERPGRADAEGVVGLDARKVVAERDHEGAERVYKVSRSVRGERLAWLKVTGGVLRAKTVVSGDERSHRVQEKLGFEFRYRRECDVELLGERRVECCQLLVPERVR